MAPKWSSQLLMSGLNNELGAKAAPFLSAFVATRLVIGLNLHTGRFKWLDGLACPAGFLAWHQKCVLECPVPTHNGHPMGPLV